MTHPSRYDASVKLGVVIMDNEIPPELKAFFLREYSRQQPSETLGEPAFITHKRNATVFLGWRFRDNLRLWRHLKNKGYTVTLRKKKIPTFLFKDVSVDKVLMFTWQGRRHACFLGAWWN